MIMRYDPSELTRLLRTKITICECEGCVEYELGACWLFAVRDRYGYGAWKHNGKHLRAHRAVYERLVAVIDEELELDHLCDRHRNCVNPEHLEPVTKSENARRANARRWNKKYEPILTLDEQHGATTQHHRFLPQHSIPQPPEEP